MAATTKVTITLRNDELKRIRSLVASGLTGSVSAFVQHAVEVGLYDVTSWPEMLKESLERTGGPMTKAEREWADSVLFPPKKKSTRGKAA